MQPITVRKECPTCKASGLVPLSPHKPTEVLVCPLCDGRGWVPLEYVGFSTRAMPPGISKIHTTQGAVRFKAGSRVPSVLTVAEFVRQFPSE